MIYRRGAIWWYRFNWRTRRIQESTKCSNKRVAQQIEAARKTELAKGEVGIRDRKPVPTLKEFAEAEFPLPYLEAQFLEKPRTLAYYKGGLKNLCAFPPLASAPIDSIKSRATESQRS